MEITLPVGITGFLSLFLPLLIAKINLKVVGKKARYVVALVISAVLGCLVTMITRQFAFNTIEALYASIITAAAFSQAIYALYWRNKIKKTAKTNEATNA